MLDQDLGDDLTEDGEWLKWTDDAFVLTDGIDSFCRTADDSVWLHHHCRVPCLLTLPHVPITLQEVGYVISCCSCYAYDVESCLCSSVCRTEIVCKMAKRIIKAFYLLSAAFSSHTCIQNSILNSSMFTLYSKFQKFYSKFQHGHPP